MIKIRQWFEQMAPQAFCLGLCFWECSHRENLPPPLHRQILATGDWKVEEMPPFPSLQDDLTIYFPHFSPECVKTKSHQKFLSGCLRIEKTPKYRGAENNSQISSRIKKRLNESHPTAMTLPAPGVRASQAKRRNPLMCTLSVF